MSCKKQSICETLISNATTIMVVENKKHLSQKLLDYMHNNNSSVTIKSKNLRGNFKVKPYDIYVIDCSSYNDTETQSIIEHIISASPESEIFVTDKCDEQKKSLNTQLKKRSKSISKYEAITDNITCDEHGFATILTAVSSVEYTKFKIHELWHKLENA